MKHCNKFRWLIGILSLAAVVAATVAAVVVYLEKKKKDGRLHIFFREENNFFVIYVEDNGDFITEETLETMRAKLKENTTGTKMSGLFNIHRRLEIQYGNESGLFFSKLPEGGLQVKLKIRIETQ